MWSLKIVYHFLRTILFHRVPVWAAISFFKSPMVSSVLHLTRTFFPRRSLQTTSIIVAGPTTQLLPRTPRSAPTDFYTNRSEVIKVSFLYALQTWLLKRIKYFCCYFYYNTLLSWLIYFIFILSSTI